ncbi:MAG: hypothetical protein ACFE95_18675 [Candidatus Hodarchaeota archaeon]
MESLTHKPNTDHPEWNESFYFCFADNNNNIRGMSRIGFKPNKPEHMTFFFLFLPDGSAAGYHTTESIKEYSNPFKVGGMTHHRLPDGNWKYTFDGQLMKVKNPENFLKIREKPNLVTGFLNVKMNLNFKPINETYEYSKFMTEESLKVGKKSGDEHWEQIALVSGVIQLEEESLHINEAMGQRDHTHGVRDWTGVGNWLYYVIWFNKDLAVNPAAIIADDGRLSTGGFLFKDGRNIPLKTIKILDQQFRKDGIMPISSKLELIDWDNQKHILIGRVGPIIPIPFEDQEEKKSVLIQSFGYFELDGIPGGYGTFETLRKVE